MIRITEQNAEERIREAIHMIMHNFSEWDADAMGIAQQEQTSEAYDAAMADQLGCVLSGMVFDDSKDVPELKPSLSVISLLGESSLVVCDGISTVRIHLKRKGVEQLIDELNLVLDLSAADDPECD